jgi:hypothetical protein
MKYNHVHNVVISADAKGLLEYWSPSTLEFPEQEYVVAHLQLFLTSCGPSYIVMKTFCNYPEEPIRA